MGKIEVKNVGTGHRVGHDILEQSMHKKVRALSANGLPGAVVYQERILDFNAKVLPFLNPTLGTAMNQNVTFGGTPELIFDGGSGGTEWASSGDPEWNFADGGKVVVTQAANNSSALFEDAGTIDTSTHSALTGKIDLDNFTPSTQDILLQFRLSGDILGDQISLKNYINVGDFAEQSFSIPLGDFNLGGVTVDEFKITVQRSAGPQPHFKLDDFQIEETGESIVFKAQPKRGERVHIKEFFVTAIDNISSIIAGSTTTYPTMPGLSYDKFLGVSSLTNGLVYTRFQDNEIQFSASFKNIGDLLSSGAQLRTSISDGVNTLITIAVEFDDWLILDGIKGDYLSFTVNDNLSGLIQLIGIARGKIEIN